MFVQVINLATSTDRMEECKRILGEQKIKFTRLNATYGLNDLRIIELSNNGNDVGEVKIEKLKNKEIKLKNDVEYYIFDKNYPELRYKYWLSVEKMIIRKKSRQRHLTIGEFGCMLSHLRAIYNVANGKEDQGLILEDDMVMADGFNEKLKEIVKFAPRNYGILKLDGTSVRDLFRGNNHKSSFLFSTIKYGYNKCFYNAKAEILHGVSGATGYIITKRCAKKIIELLKTETLNGLEGATDILLYVVLPKKYNFQDIFIIKKPLVWQSGVESSITKLGR